MHAITAPAGHAEWLTRDSLAYIQPHANTLTQIRLRHEQIAASGTVTIRGTIAGFTSSPDGRRIAIAVNTDRHLRILVIDPPTFGNVAAATVRQQLSLETRRGAVAQLDWR